MPRQAGSCRSCRTLDRMTTVIRWQARRGAEGKPEQFVEAAADLGRAAHVHKVLSKTFTGAVPETNILTWSGPGLTLIARPELADRPKFVDFEIHLHGITVDEAIVKLSPRFRRLASDRNWIVFNAETQQPMLLAPPGRAPRRKKGLVSITIAVPKLHEELESLGSGSTLIVGGLASVEALDTFLDAKPPPEDLIGASASFGWTNIELRPPDGTRFFVVHFRGQAAVMLHEWYAKTAAGAQLPIASIAEGSLRVLTPSKLLAYSLDDCHLFIHNVWESSVAPRH